MTIQMKASEQYFPVLLCIVPWKAVLTFEFIPDEIHLNESFWAVFSCDAVY